MRRVNLIAAIVLGLSGAASGNPKKPPTQPKPAAPKDAKPADAEAPAAAPQRKPKDDFEAAVFFFQDTDRTGWSNEKCETAADKFLSAGKGKRAEAFFNAGVSVQRCGKYGDAEKYYRKALEVTPNHAPALAGLGELAMRNGKIQEAQDLFERAIKNDTNREASAAFTNLGWLEYQQMRQTTVAATRQQLEATALGNLQRALAIDNDNVMAYTVMALIYMEGADKNRNRLDLADLLITEGKKRNDRSASLWNASGLLKMKRNNVAKALEDFRQAVAIDPKMAEARMNIGQIVLSSRNYDEAETQFRAVLSLRKNDYAALIGLGVALRGQATVLRSGGQGDKFGKKIDEAEETYRQAMEVDKNRGDAYYNLGLLYKDYRTNDADQSKNIGQYKKARQFFQDYMARADKADPKREDAQGHIQDCDKYVEILSQAMSGAAPTAGGAGKH
jgi:tetratricopeptide (TPR) repeat protein